MGGRHDKRRRRRTQGWRSIACGVCSSLPLFPSRRGDRGDSKQSSIRALRFTSCTLRHAWEAGLNGP